jgi:hypothetical protein
MSQPDPGGPIQPNYRQYNAPSSGGTVYSNQGTGNQVINQQYVDPAADRRHRSTTRVLVGFLLADVLYVFYGMWSYTGRNTSADMWRALIYLVMLVTTIRLIRRWLRQRV